MPGKRGNFCVLVDRYDIKLGALKGKRLIASKSEDWRNPHYEYCAESVTDDDGGRVADDTPSSRIRSQEARNMNKKETSRAASPPLAHPLAEIWNLFRGPLAEVKLLSAGRLAKCRARAREISEGEFREIVQLAVATPFCRGVNDRGWRVDFDWLIANDTNLLKVKEGRYSNGGAENGTRHDHSTTDTAAANIRASFN